MLAVAHRKITSAYLAGAEGIPIQRSEMPGHFQAVFHRLLSPTDWCEIFIKGAKPDPNSRRLSLSRKASMRRDITDVGACLIVGMKSCDWSP